ncbi:MAG: RNA 2',3'-cyclic phosphodiesterase [Gloeomargarita sp. SKYBB_i_bin120]|nr:RNA 2',3'-cyclic phosphodiesterase [Gloeomargarita sp. SKYG98]MCS7291651.1 RNA 2',3'-cyclic phosphodiesterase [Gloeomargarita sp. SKYB120]MDW8177210.1 RNA 2',3'-cyclic phosphodiesterase [Gloeomargarita sp. SKYBB_i_bin120]
MTTTQDQPLRTFLAIPPDPTAREYLTIYHERLTAQAWSEQVRWVNPEQWHLTVRFFGNLRPTQVATLIQLLNQKLSFSALPLTLTQPSFLPNQRQPHVIACRVPTTEGLQNLVNCTENCVRALGLPQEKRPFRGHITLGRLRNKATLPTSIIDIDQEQSAAWQANRLVLYQSALTPQGSYYQELAAWSLGS